jgi:hypothetical protein
MVSSIARAESYVWVRVKVNQGGVAGLGKMVGVTAPCAH